MGCMGQEQLVEEPKLLASEGSSTMFLWLDKNPKNSRVSETKYQLPGW